MLDSAISIRPRRQLSVQFSGGEPPLSPYFINAIKYSRKVGYKPVLIRTGRAELNWIVKQAMRGMSGNTAAVAQAWASE